MPNDPLALDDPSHPLHGFAADFGRMRARRQMYDQRQQMMAQQLAQPGPAPTMGGGMPAPVALPVQTSPLAIGTAGLAGLAQALKGQAGQDTYSSKIGGTGQAENTGGWMQNLFTANGGAKS